MKISGGFFVKMVFFVVSSFLCPNWAGGDIEEFIPGAAGPVSSIRDSSLDITGTD